MIVRKILDVLLTALRVVKIPSHCELGDAARDSGRWPEAAYQYRLHLKKVPNDHGIWVQCGHAEKEQGRFAEAEACYAKADALNPSDADLALQRGHLAKIRGHRAEAQKFYGAALALDPDMDDALREMEGFASTPSASTQESSTNYALDINDPASLRTEHHIDGLIISQRQLADPAQLAHLAHALSEQGRCVEAARIQRLVAWHSPEDPDVWESLAQYLMLMGDVEQSSRARSIARSLLVDLELNH